MVKLFSYGTLKDIGIQNALFNETINMEEAILYQYRLYEDTDGYYFVKEEEGHSIDGFILDLTEEQMWIIDQWEELPLYIREKIEPPFLADTNGTILKDVWIYKRPFSEGVPVVENKLSSLDYNRVLKEAVEFKENLSSNEITFADVYLSIPCCAKKYEHQKVRNCATAKSFINEFNKTTSAEFSDYFVSSLERKLIEEIKLIIEVKRENSKKTYEQRCNIFLTLHKDSQLAVITVALPVIQIPTHYLIDNLATSRIKVLNLDGEPTDFYKWLKEKGLISYGKPRALVFSQKKIEHENLLKLLINEAETIGKVKENNFLEMAKNDLAQYDTAEIYASETCLIEISSTFSDHYIDRLESQILTLFVIELLLFQDGAISRLDAKVDKEIKEQKNNPNRNNSVDVIEGLVNESTNSIKFWNVRNFKYPAAEQLAHNISAAFKIEKINNIHEKNKQKLEQLINIHSVKITPELFIPRT